MPAGSELNEQLGRARKHETYRVRSEAGFCEERLWIPDEAHEHHWGELIEDKRTTMERLEELLEVLLRRFGNSVPRGLTEEINRPDRRPKGERRSGI